MSEVSSRGDRRLMLGVAGVVVGLGIAGLTWYLFLPSLGAVESPPERLSLPEYDYKPWHALPVQEDGRIKPFESACEDTVRKVTGATRFDGQDPVAVVLAWLMLRDTSAKGAIDWEHLPFILCRDRELRRQIYADAAEKAAPLTAEQLYGKWVAPADVRRSASLQKLVAEAREIEDKDSEKASQLMNPEQRAAQEVSGRLALFDSISTSPALRGQMPRSPGARPDPFHFVALDRVANGAWFSLGEVRQCYQERESQIAVEAERARLAGRSPVPPTDPEAWQQIMRERLRSCPQLYIKPECRAKLEEFQRAIATGASGPPLDALAQTLTRRNLARVQAFRDRHRGEATLNVDAIIHDELMAALDENGQHRVATWIHQQGADSVARDGLAAQCQLALEEQSRQLIDALGHRVPGAGVPYIPDDPRFRMLHLDYLEAQFPNLYADSAAWQRFPAADAARLVHAFERVHGAYVSQDALRFATESENFISTVREVSAARAPYPGSDTATDRLGGLVSGRPAAGPSEQLINWELTYDHVQPFRWAWLLMLAAVGTFAVHLALPRRAIYLAGWAWYMGSLAFQLMGFTARVVLSGRPPVSNMYESVIWVAFMSSMFGLVLELVYRRTVIILAASLVSTLGLVLADQLPLALDPRISPIVAVLRSNYWLTIHVLTIVSSYAGGTLAWGLGNLSLALLAFGRPDRSTLRTLSQFTYRAVQIAVLLLAAGTFLGGWWATESWGRFWGWDAKEVWALIALVCYVIPLHMRYIGWVKDFGLAVAAVLCYAAIVMAWYGVNFVLATGLHSYGFGGGGPWWVFWAGLINVEWVIVASLFYLAKSGAAAVASTAEGAREVVAVSD